MSLQLILFSSLMVLTENISTGGNWPRFFKLLDQYGYLLVGNMRSNQINVLKVQDDGSLKATEHKLAIDQPAYIESF